MLELGAFGKSLAVCAARDDKQTVRPALLLIFWLGRFTRFLCERLYPFEFLLKSPSEIVGSVLEKHDKTEGEEDKEDDPKKAPEQRHVPMVTYSPTEVNEGEWTAKVPIEPPGEAAILSQPCACLCSI